MEKKRGYWLRKNKTHKGTKKRFRLTATGKAMHRSSGTSHLAKGLTKKRRRNLRGTTAVAECMEPTIHAALNGYSY
ncbi:MAG: 50S ribosomal protein L35 [Novipirellula sp. JB048]